MNSKGKKHRHRDWFPVPNNPRDNELYVDNEDKRREDEFNKDRMLFDGLEKNSSLIRERRIELVKRMIKSYNKHRRKIEGEQEKSEPSQSEKRRQKLIDLISRSSSWKGLE